MYVCSILKVAILEFGEEMWLHSYGVSTLGIWLVCEEHLHNLIWGLIKYAEKL